MYRNLRPESLGSYRNDDVDVFFFVGLFFCFFFQYFFAWFQLIDVANSSVLFTPSKVEIKLRKAEPMKWNRLDVPRAAPAADADAADAADATDAGPAKAEELPRVDVLDLSDL